MSHLSMLYTRISFSCLALLLIIGSIGCSSSAMDPEDPDNPAYLITENNTLVLFDLDNPSNAQSVGVITGLEAGDNILGIDFRPATGTLYLLGSGASLYTVNTSTGVAEHIASLTEDGTPLALDGTAFGVDFNPVPDRLRVVSTSGQNLRINVENGETIVDGDLMYADGDANHGTAPSIVAAGYTNSSAGAESTSLYVIDSNLDIVALQDPPNDGTLNTVGSLGANVTNTTAFDIQSPGNTAFAVVQGSSGPELHRINVSTGSATLVGSIGVSGNVRGLAIPTP